MHKPARCLIACIILSMPVWLAGCSVVRSVSQEVNRAMDMAKGMVPASSYILQTEDGWDLNVVRINGAAKDSGRLPVVLCHGFGHNGYLWRAGGTESMAQYLARAGLDVWIPDLRGSGSSTKPGFLVMRTFFKMPPSSIIDRAPRLIADFTKVNWNVDDHITKDVPAILDLVKRETGCQAVNWVGHSMGGMVILAYMEDMGLVRRDVNGIVALCSPMIIPHPLNDALAVIQKNPELFKMLNFFVNQGIPSVVGAASAGSIQTGLDYLYFNNENMSRGAVMELLYYVVEDISPGSVDQFMHLIATGRFLSADGKTDYSSRLDRIEIPIFAVAGKADNIAEAECMRFLYRDVRSTDKAFKLFGVNSGAIRDYGHTDLIMGMHSKAEVFPVLTQWLLAHSSSAPSTRPATRPSALNSQQALHAPVGRLAK